MFEHIDHIDRDSMMNSAPHGTQTFPTGDWVFDVDRTSVVLSAPSVLAQRVYLRFALQAGARALVDSTGVLQRVDMSLLTATVSTGAQRRDDRLRGPAFLDTAHYPTIDYCGRANSDLIDGVLQAKTTRSALALEATNATLRDDDTLAFAARGTLDRKQLGLFKPATFMVSHELTLEVHGIAYRAAGSA